MMTRIGHVARQEQGHETTFVDPDDKFWDQYLSKADLEDRTRIEKWNGDTNGILVFTGLFASTLATFVVDSYKNILPPSSSQTSASSNGASPSSFSTTVSPLAVAVNALWFLSLFTSLMCALSATLMQQWSRAYLRDVQWRGPPRKRGPVHVFILMGVERFGLDGFSSAIISLLHISVLLFTLGLIINLYIINIAVFVTVAAAMTLCATAYVVLSILPLIYDNCPFQTPFTQLSASIGLPFLYTMRLCTSARIWSFKFNFLYRLLTRADNAVEKLVLSMKRILRKSSSQHQRQQLPHSISLGDTAIFAIQRTTESLDEIHELGSFIDGMNLAFRTFNSSQYMWGVSLPFDKQLLCRLFTQDGLDRHITAILRSCYRDGLNRSSPNADAVRRMHSALQLLLCTLVTLLYEEDSTLIISWLNSYEAREIAQLLSHFMEMMGTPFAVSVGLFYTGFRTFALRGIRSHETSFFAWQSDGLFKRDALDVLNSAAFSTIFRHFAQFSDVPEVEWQSLLVSAHKSIGTQDTSILLVANAVDFVQDLLDAVDMQGALAPDLSLQHWIDIVTNTGFLYPEPSEILLHKITTLLERAGLGAWLSPQSNFSGISTVVGYARLFNAHSKVAQVLKMAAIYRQQCLKGSLPKGWELELTSTGDLHFMNRAKWAKTLLDPRQLMDLDLSVELRPAGPAALSQEAIDFVHDALDDTVYGPVFIREADLWFFYNSMSSTILVSPEPVASSSALPNGTQQLLQRFGLHSWLDPTSADSLSDSPTETGYTELLGRYPMLITILRKTVVYQRLCSKGRWPSGWGVQIADSGKVTFYERDEKYRWMTRDSEPPIKRHIQVAAPAGSEESRDPSAAESGVFNTGVVGVSADLSATRGLSHGDTERRPPRMQEHNVADVDQSLVGSAGRPVPSLSSFSRRPEGEYHELREVIVQSDSVGGEDAYFIVSI